VQASVHYGGLDTKGWAYYCTGDHPYYWNNDSTLGFGSNFSFNNNCFDQAVIWCVTCGS
jgi:hypothetical protein